MPRCASCPKPVASRQARRCPDCALLERRKVLAANRHRALAAQREQYKQRLKIRLQTTVKAGDLYRTAYQRGYQACYQWYLRAVRRGDILVLKERRIKEVA